MSEEVIEKKVTGADLLGKALARQGVNTMFYLMGAPTYDAAHACTANGIRIIDARHEQGAAMMAQAYARVLGKPAVCMACSGPGTVNLASGIANAMIEAQPVDAAVLGRLALADGIEAWRARNAAEGLPRPLYLRGVNVTAPDGSRRTVD